MTDNSGNVQVEYIYDPYGRTAKANFTQDSDYQFGTFYVHSRSSLNTTVFRTYSASLGRWLRREPAGELAGWSVYKHAGVNLYGYVTNAPTMYIDQHGSLLSARRDQIQNRLTRLRA